MMEAYKILLVDDDPVINKYLKLLLSGEGYLVDDSESASHAIDLMEKRAYDLVISDIVMDDTDGLELLQKIKEKHPHIPFILITGYASLETANEAFRLGAYDYLQKPIDPEELLLRVKNACPVNMKVPMPAIHKLDPNEIEILIVEDSTAQALKLRTILEENGYSASVAHNGVEAFSRLQEHIPSLIISDIMMPEMDGYETLTRIKQDEQLRHIPVIIISAVDEIDSVVRCIKIGAVDYLAKPFNSTLLRARLTSSLAEKRLRDLEIEYLEQVNLVMQAAASVEDETFELSVLDSVSGRDDALGQLARVFNRMASEVKLREERLKRQVQDLRIEIDEARQEKKVAEITDTVVGCVAVEWGSSH